MIYKKNKILSYEKGYIQSKKKYSIKVVLIYPNYYKIGMSNLGFQTIYKTLNEFENVKCERAFLPENFNCNNIKSLESKTKIENFDIIAFSISFENDILSIIHILKKSKIPILSSNRNNNEPLIIAGGTLCSLNPEPLSSFIDCFFIGESEIILKKFFNHFDKNKSKKKFLLKLANKIPNLYIPSIYEIKYYKNDTIKKIISHEKISKNIKRAIINNISDFPTHSSIITPNTIFKNIFLIETSKGCEHGCRFCTAGYIYRPIRFQNYEVLKKKINKGIKLTNKIGLIGTAISDNPHIKKIYENKNWDNIDFKISSLRADKVNNNIINFLKKNKIKSISIAPDAGSERLRKVINKKIDENEILNAIKNLLLSNIINIKLYFIIGLPTENEEDIESIINLCKKIKKEFLNINSKTKKIGKIIVNINPFIPKPFTPFQWVSMEKKFFLKKKFIYIKKHLNSIPNIFVQSTQINNAYIQGILSRGDRRLDKFLISAYKNNFNWPKTLKEFNNIMSFYSYRERKFNEIFPWDFIKNSVNKKFLLNEYKLALNNQESNIKCKNNKKCKICGICNNF